MEQQKPNKYHPLSLGVTQDDIDGLEKMKELEKKFQRRNVLVKIKIGQGYIYTTNPDKYKNSNNINIINK